ncbi:MAG: hypothetical protein NDJ94_23490 [Vicinamibacteria bacterium]|nr:hypothetical protein [Vicinamibacteria bacterium]
MILEEMRSQNRLTIEAVEATRVVLEGRLDRIERESRDRDGLLGLAIGELRTTMERNDRESRDRDNGLELALRETRVDLRVVQAQGLELSAKVDALTRIESRVAALERRLA